jgi:gamma-glutamyltranspeptidase
MLAAIVVGLNDVRRRMVDHAAMCRRMGETDDDTVYFKVADLDRLVVPLTQSIAGICHVINPDGHTLAVKNRCDLVEDNSHTERVWP